MIPGRDVLNLDGSYFLKAGRFRKRGDKPDQRAGPKKIPTIFIRDGDIMIKHIVTVP